MRLRMAAWALVSVCFCGTALANPQGVELKDSRTNSSHPSNRSAPAPGTLAPATYKLLAWSELGMHCMDGKDYSIFAVLPPYNVIHAQLVQMGEPPQRISSGVTITYEATADPTGSINTISSTKTNF